MRYRIVPTRYGYKPQRKGWLGLWVNFWLGDEMGPEIAYYDTLEEANKCIESDRAERGRAYEKIVYP
jgi:hypothetical protein